MKEAGLVGLGAVIGFWIACAVVDRIKKVDQASKPVWSEPTITTSSGLYTISNFSGN